MKLNEIKEVNSKILDKPTPTIEELVKKHDVTSEYLKKQLEQGIGVEMEHTSDKDLAKEIALDHLNELPDYYERLEKVEK